MNLYPLLRPLLAALGAETAHRFTIWALQRAPQRKAAPDEAILATRVFGLEFPNPVGIAAGFDKHGEVPLQLAALGFGFVEIGSVTPRPQPGNPRPRVFRLAEDRAVINRYGFNSVGAAQVAANLERQHGRGPVPLGVNLGKNKDTPAERAADDFAKTAEALRTFAGYVVVNVSSPNTPGLRALQGRVELEAILARVERVLEAGDGGAAAPPRHRPLLVKIAPDLAAADLADIAAVALAGRCDGLIISNTTTRRPETLKSRHRGEAGGLSGAPLKPFALETLRAMYRLTEGRVPLVGVGGIASGADAYERIRAGASLVQLYTALVYEGPALVGRIKRDLAALLRRDRFAAVAAAVGADHR
ncbi:MAG TPA: quinone-dependent dihydroorotate dehydrogenase [Alphaproteobacteria bacterium]|jgi:dihydroorotate dehydrogenase